MKRLTVVVVSIVAACGSGSSQQAPGATADAAPAPVVTVDAAAPPPVAPPPEVDHLAKADEAARAGKWDEALRFAEHVLGAQPDGATQVKAATIAALAACNLKDAAKAKQHYAALPANRQTLVRQRCLANGVTVE